MEEKASPALKAAFMEVAGNQLRDLAPPGVIETCDTLTADGLSDESARSLIASALACEMFEMLMHKKKHSHERYIELLRKLPEMPWD